MTHAACRPQGSSVTLEAERPLEQRRRPWPTITRTATPGADHGRLLVAFGITALIRVAEVNGAVVTGSLALLADAGHMFTDAAGLLIAVIAATVVRRPPTMHRTWGYARARCWPPRCRPVCC